MQDFDQNIAINDHDVEKAEKFRRERRTSILVIMFTDIEGSTALREKLGDVRFDKILEEHDSTLLPIIAEQGGLHIKSVGDGIMAVFSEPSSAVQCALKMQERLHGHSWLTVRVGMDMGQVAAEEARGVLKDVFGRFVNRAARVDSLANGGHILVTDQIQDSARGWIPKEQISWFCHGERAVKGVETPLRIWEPYNSNLTDPAAGLVTKVTIEQRSAESMQPKRKEHGVRLSLRFGAWSLSIKVGVALFSAVIVAVLWHRTLMVTSEPPFRFPEPRHAAQAPPVTVSAPPLAAPEPPGAAPQAAATPQEPPSTAPESPGAAQNPPGDSHLPPPPVLPAPATEARAARIFKAIPVSSGTKVIAEDGLAFSYNPKSHEVLLSFSLVVTNDRRRRDVIRQGSATLEVLSLPTHPAVPLSNPSFTFLRLTKGEEESLGLPFSVEKESSMEMRCSIVDTLSVRTREVFERPGALRLSVRLKGKRDTHTLQFCFHLTDKVIAEMFESEATLPKTLLFPVCPS